MKLKQNGSVLLASLIIILLFTSIAMIAAKRSRVAEKVTGANTRYQTVFEAAESSLKEAVSVLDSLAPFGRANPTPNVEFNGNNSIIARLTNFPNGVVNSIEKHDPINQFVWEKHALSNLFNSSGNQNQLFNFHERIDAPFWGQAGIVTQFSANNYDPNNNLQNIQTYTFIEAVATNNKLMTFRTASEAMSSATATTFYRITVKASGFPPGTLQNVNAGTRPFIPSPLLARENVVIQRMYSY